MCYIFKYLNGETVSLEEQAQFATVFEFLPQYVQL